MYFIPEYVSEAAGIVGLEDWRVGGLEDCSIAVLQDCRIGGL